MVRSTAKYWVRMCDVSTVKHHILQHLPVFQYNQGADFAGDAQLVNSGGCLYSLLYLLNQFFSCSWKYVCLLFVRLLCVWVWRGLSCVLC